MTDSPARRALLLMIGSMATSCAGPHSPAIPGVRSATVAPDQPIVLQREEGVVAGVALFAMPVLTGLVRSLVIRRRHQLIFMNEQTSQQYSVRLMPVLEDTSEVRRGDLSVFQTPFAIILPAGAYRVLGIADYSVQGSAGIYQWSLRRAPDARFNVAPNAVNTLGAVGLTEATRSQFVFSNNARYVLTIHSAFPNLRRFEQIQQNLTAPNWEQWA